MLLGIPLHFDITANHIFYKSIFSFCKYVKKKSIQNYSLRGCIFPTTHEELREEYLSLLLSKTLLPRFYRGKINHCFNYLKIKQRTHLGHHICHVPPQTLGLPFPLAGYILSLTLKLVCVCLCHDNSLFPIVRW